RTAIVTPSMRPYSAWVPTFVNDNAERVLNRQRRNRRWIPHQSIRGRSSRYRNIFRKTDPLAKACSWPMSGAIAYDFVETNSCKIPQQHQRVGPNQRNWGKTRGNSSWVMAGLVPAIPTIGAPCPADRDRRDKPGDDELAATSFGPITNQPDPGPTRI